MTWQRLRLVAMGILALFAVACGSGSSASVTPAVATIPPGYVTHSGSGYTIALGPDWNVAKNPPNGLLMFATNTVAGHRWQLLLGFNADTKPASQSFDDWAQTQRSKCTTGTVPDTLVVPAGSVYVCRVDTPGLVVLDYRLPVGGNQWDLALAFQDGKYAGTGQEQAETTLRTLDVTP